MRTPTGQLLLWVVFGGVIGFVLGSVVDLVSGNQGWWLVLLFAGFLFGGFYGYWHRPAGAGSSAKPGDQSSR